MRLRLILSHKLVARAVAQISIFVHAATWRAARAQLARRSSAARLTLVRHLCATPVRRSIAAREHLDSRRGAVLAEDNRVICWFNGSVGLESFCEVPTTQATERRWETVSRVPQRLRRACHSRR